jgi:hypothetical protein
LVLTPCPPKNKVFSFVLLTLKKGAERGEGEEEEWLWMVLFG